MKDPFCSHRSHRFHNLWIRRTDCTRLFTECGGDDGNLMAHGSPLESIEVVSKWSKQSVVCLRNAAADNHDLRIERIDERRDRCPEMMDRPKPDCCCLRVACKMCFDKLPCGSESSAGTIGKVVVTNHLLETAGSVHNIRRP